MSRSREKRKGAHKAWTRFLRAPFVSNALRKEATRPPGRSIAPLKGRPLKFSLLPIIARDWWSRVLPEKVSREIYTVCTPLRITRREETGRTTSLFYILFTTLTPALDFVPLGPCRDALIRGQTEGFLLGSLIFCPTSLHPSRPFSDGSRRGIACSFTRPTSGGGRCAMDLYKENIDGKRTKMNKIYEVLKLRIEVRTSDYLVPSNV